MRGRTVAGFRRDLQQRLVGASDKTEGAFHVSRRHVGMRRGSERALEWLARSTTLRSWLWQWSLDDSCGNGLEGAKRMRAPLLVIENSADDAVPQTHPKMLFEAAAPPDTTYRIIRGATHYYAGQPERLKEAMGLIRAAHRAPRAPDRPRAVRA